MTLLFWRFTSGLYYELISVPAFGNEFGDGFQAYVGDVIEQACPEPMQRLGEQKYIVGKNEKRSVDWIIANEGAAIFLECKARRLSWNAKVSLTDLAPLEADIAGMADEVVKVYKTIKDYLDGAYQHFPLKEGLRIFPTVVTPENWRMFGPVMMSKLADAIVLRFTKATLPLEFLEQMPYSILAIEELEEALQIIYAVGIRDFMEGKLANGEVRQWDWHGYMIQRYPKYAPKELFREEYNDMFAELFRAQGVAVPNF